MVYCGRAVRILAILREHTWLDVRGGASSTIVERATKCVLRESEPP